MKLLFLGKRLPQGRDLIGRPYGRFHHLPRILAERGHQVHLALLSYGGLPSEERRFGALSCSADDLWPGGWRPFFSRLRRVIEQLRPDWVIGVSDTWFGILAERAARACGARYAIDAYDDFESYMPWAKPLHWAWRGALRRTHLLTVPGPQLGQLLHQRGAPRAHVLPMCADPEFKPLDRNECRAALGLPADRLLVGHIGAFDRRRGRGIMLQALESVRRQRPEVSLVLSGRQSRQFRSAPGVLGLGYIADELMPALVGSLDVACIALADNAFGRSSYPVKLCEALAAGVPAVASATAPTQWMLRGDSRLLAPVGDAEAMAGRVLGALGLGRIDYGPRPSWGEVAIALEALLASK